MGEYNIKGSVPFPIYQFADGEEIDFTGKPYTKLEYPYDEFPIPSSDKFTLWEGSGGYLKIFGHNNNNNPWNIEMSTITGSNPAYTGTLISRYNFQRGASAFIWAFTLPDGTFRVQVYPRWEADGYDDALGQINSDPTYNGNALYIGTWDPNSNIVEYVDGWDETPSEDENNPFNENAIGGEFADRGDFDETFLQDVLPDPEDMENVDTGGVICCYSLDSSHMYLLNQCLFEADFWQNLANRFSGLSDPLSMILQCVELPLIPARGSVAVAKIGGISIMTPAEGGSSHSIDLPCPQTRYGRYYIGNLINKEVWGSEKDYSATSVSIYLPYVGVKELDVDVVMDNTLELWLYVDYWTGDILYLLRVSNSIRPAKYYTQTSVVYRWTGNCAREVPLGRIDNTGPILHAASAIGSAFAGFVGGASVSTVAASSGLDIEADTTQIQTGSPNVPKNLNGFINGFTPTIQTSGNIAGNVGSMDYQYPYLIIKRGVPEYPNGWRGEIGAPRNQMLTISSLSGYTLFSTVYLENIECMAEEKAELERLLTTEGVIL